MIRAVALLVILLFGAAASAQQVFVFPSNAAIPGQAPLCSIRGANFNVTTDQICALPAAVTAWDLTSIEVTNCSASLTLAAGGVYTAASKGGTALVSAAQAYTGLTSSTVVLPLTLNGTAATTRLTISSVYLSLTTAQGSAATCDMYVWGKNLT